jgi:hypothetical protein
MEASNELTAQGFDARSQTFGAAVKLALEFVPELANDKLGFVDFLGKTTFSKD